MSFKLMLDICQITQSVLQLNKTRVKIESSEVFFPNHENWATAHDDGKFMTYNHIS